MGTDQDSKASHQPRVNSSKEIARTKWLALNSLEWMDETGTVRVWDSASRTTKTETTAVDAVIIIPILRDPTDASKPAETLFVEQFRPPVGTRTLEFPAGLIDSGETVEQAAVRELREETGYVGEACRIPPIASPKLCMSPGLCNEIVQVVMVDVDLSNPYNHGTPTPQLDPGEFCTVRRVTLEDGMQQLMLSGSDAPMPIMGLYLFAMGWELGRKGNSNGEVLNK